MGKIPRLLWKLFWNFAVHVLKSVTFAIQCKTEILSSIVCVADISLEGTHTVYPKKYAHGFVVLCFVVVMQSFIMNAHEVFIHIHQGCFAGTGAIVRLPQCQWSEPDGYGKISQCITTTKHSKAKAVCIFLGIYCMYILGWFLSQNHKDVTSSRTEACKSA